MIINNWKNKVKDDDTVYILGDVGMYHAREIGNILNNLPGRKILVTGNHDFKNIHSSSYKKTFAKITSYLEIEDNGRNVVLFHYPIEDWNGKYRGTITYMGTFITMEILYPKKTDGITSQQK